LTVATDYAQATWVGTGNFGYPERGDRGRLGHRPVAIVDHVAEGTCAGCVSWFRDPTSDASATYLVCQDGAVLQFVAEADAAWANGVDFSRGWLAYGSDRSIPWIADCWADRVNPNLVTISIEHEGFSGAALTELQYASTLALHRDIVRRNAWPTTDGAPSGPRVVGHFALDRVNRGHCPGSAFPWARLRNDLRILSRADLAPRL
jgi:N-acetyl-anhydromuramyl-L-alanine amidase AmpD